MENHPHSKGLTVSLNVLLENAHPQINLTPKELGVLQSLHEGTYDRQSLMISVWGFSESLAAKVTYEDTRMVDVAIGRLKKKLAPVGIGIRSIRGVGYSLISI